MDENIKDSEQEEEFHFTEPTETTNAFAAAPSEGKSRFGNINIRNVLIALGILVLVVAAYKLIDVFFFEGGKTKTTTTTTQTTTHPTIIATQPIQPGQQPQLPVQSSGPTDSERLSQVQQHTVESKEKLETVKNKLSKLETSVSNIQGTLSTMNDQLDQINNTLQQQQTAINALKKPTLKKVKRHYPIEKKVARRAKVKYYVQAMLPGRAWLIRQDGTTMTVSKGDKLSGYGTIHAILPVRGIVVTSSGAIIRYKSLSSN